MLDFTVIEAVRNSVTEAMLMCEELGVTQAVIVAEVKNFSFQVSILPECSRFTFQEIKTRGVDDERYVNFLSDHMRRAHVELLEGEVPARMGWEKNWIYVDHCVLQYPDEPYSYSVAVDVITSDNDKSKAILNDIMRDITACQPR